MSDDQDSIREATVVVATREINRSRGANQVVSDRTGIATLKDRGPEITQAIVDIAELLKQSAAPQPSGPGGITEIEATFGITLGFEAGIFVSKVDAQASLEIRVKIEIPT
jgi:hypothetical protein